MAQTLLITASDVVTECFTFVNTDPSLVKNTHIEAAQLNSIKPILGQELYDTIIAHKAANTLTSDETALINNYIKRPLMWYSYANCLINVFNQSGANGVFQQRNEFGSSVSQAAFANSKAEATRIADSYGEILRKYLEDNTTTFPLYKKESETKYSFGIILD